MHQTSAGRKAIYIPHSVLAMPLDELASRLAAAICPLKEYADGVTQDMEADAAWYAHAKASGCFRHGLITACEAGQLSVRDNVAHMQCSPEEKGAVVLVDEAANYLTASGASVRITRHAEVLAFIGLHPSELVPLDDVPMLVATAMHDPETDGEWHGFQRLVTEKRIYEAAEWGSLAMFDPLTRQRLSIRTTGACVTAGDLCAFFGEGHKGPSKPAPEMLPEPVVWNGQIYQPGPHLTDEKVEAARMEVEAIQAAEARSQAREQEAAQERIQRNWWGVSSAYIVSVMQTHQFATAKDLFNTLHQLAGDDSPFERGEGLNRGSLFVKALAKKLELKTVQNKWKEIKEAAHSSP